MRREKTFASSNARDVVLVVVFVGVLVGVLVAVLLDALFCCNFSWSRPDGMREAVEE